MARKYDPQIVADNLELMFSKNGVKPNLEKRASREYNGEELVAYSLTMLYDTRDGRIISCSPDLPLEQELPTEVDLGLISKVTFKIQDKKGKMRIKRMNSRNTKYVEAVKLDEDKVFYLSDSDSPNAIKVSNQTEFASNNLLETVLEFNNLFRTSA